MQVFNKKFVWSLSLTLALLVFDSCSVQESPMSVTPQSSTSLTTSRQEILIEEVKKSDSFKNFLKDANELVQKMKEGKLKIFKVNAQLLQSQLSLCKNEDEMKKVLSQVTNDPEYIITLTKSIQKNVDIICTRKSLNSKAVYSDHEIKEAFSLAIKMTAKSRNARTVGDCVGDCSEDYNITESTAKKGLYAAAASCGLFAPTVVGALGCGVFAVIGYEIAIGGALDTLGVCYDRCFE